jgi:hypothetical protein
MFDTVRAMTELPSSSRVEQCRGSVVMLPARSPALDREAAMALYDQLLEALHEVERLQHG